MKVSEDIILKYLDGELSEKEASQLMIKIESDPDIKKLFERHKAIHKTLNDDPLQSPSASFVVNVMNAVNLATQSNGRLLKRLRFISILLTVFVIATSLYYMGVNFYPTLGGIIANEITMREFTLNTQPAQQVLNSDALFKIVLYVNGVIGLFLLDRAVFKPYFTRRRERYSI